MSALETAREALEILVTLRCEVPGRIAEEVQLMIEEMHEIVSKLSVDREILKRELKSGKMSLDSLTQIDDELLSDVPEFTDGLMKDAPFIRTAATARGEGTEGTVDKDDR